MINIVDKENESHHLEENNKLCKINVTDNIGYEWAKNTKDEKDEFSDDQKLCDVKF